MIMMMDHNLRINIGKKKTNNICNINIFLSLSCSQSHNNSKLLIINKLLLIPLLLLTLTLVKIISRLVSSLLLFLYIHHHIHHHHHHYIINSNELKLLSILHFEFWKNHEYVIMEFGEANSNIL